MREKSCFEDFEEKGDKVLKMSVEEHRLHRVCSLNEKYSYPLSFAILEIQSLTRYQVVYHKPDNEQTKKSHLLSNIGYQVVDRK